MADISVWKAFSEYLNIKNKIKTQKEDSKKLKKMIYQVDDILFSMCRMSESKRKAKTENSKDPEVKRGNKSLFHEEIFSFRTYRKYRDICITFLRWCNDFDPEPNHYSLYRKYVGPFLRDCRNRGLSIKTTSNYRVALVKLYGFSPKDFNMKKLYGRTVNIDDFYKYRYASKDNINWFKYEQLTTFLTCTGLRKNEVRNLRGDALIKSGASYYLHITVGSKGGRERFAKIIGTKSEISSVITMMKLAEKEKVFRKIPDNYSYHILRSIYACRFINDVATSTNNLPRKALYYFKGEGRGYCITRKGMKEVSNSLGHNRIEVIRNYFRKSLYKKTKDRTGIDIVTEVFGLLQSGNKFE